MINGERQKEVFREEGTVFLPEGEYLERLTLMASQRATNLGSAGALAGCWTGVESLRLVQKLKLFQSKTTVTFDGFIRGERWSIVDYQQMSLDAFLPVNDIRLDYNDMGQLIHKLSGLDNVLSIGGGIEWKGCTADLVEELTTGRLMLSKVEALHYRINEAIAIFIHTVRNPELDTVTRQDRAGDEVVFDLNSLVGVIEFFKDCLASVQEDDFRNVQIFQDIIRPTLKLCSSSKPVGTSALKPKGVVGKSTSLQLPIAGGTVRALGPVTQPTTGGNKAAKKRVRDAGSEEHGAAHICVNSALYYLEECSTDCRNGSSCPYQHFSEGSSLTKAPLPDIIRMAQRLPPLKGKKEQLLTALHRLDAAEGEEE
jgi:hypothetical protein